MGLAERDYSRRPSRSSSGRFGALPAWSATTWLIAIIVGGFFLDALLTPPTAPAPAVIFLMERMGGGMQSGELVLALMGPLARWTHFSEAATKDMQVWRILTFPFVQPDVWPVMLNGVCLYAFASVMEAEIGARRLLALFFLGCLAAPLTYAALYAAGAMIHAPWWPLLGATGGVLGVVVAVACAGPDDDVTLWTTGVTVPRRTLAWIACAFLALVAVKQDSTGAGAAHLGGAVVGLLAVPLVRRGMR